MKDRIIKFVPYGEDLAGDVVHTKQVESVLGKLETALVQEGHTWSEVSLLYVANTKAAPSHVCQAETDRNILDAITALAARREWYPSLIGSSAFSAFFGAPSGFDADISDGLLFVAVLSAAFDRIPVVHEVNRENEKRDRELVGRHVLERGVDAFVAKASQLGVDVTPDHVTQTSTGLLFTTGSGHIREDQAVDFKECYAIGQELIDAAEELDASLVGGCATNRSENQLQALYYSERVGPDIVYKLTYRHAAVFTFLPYARARLRLDHPYKRDEKLGKLKIKFNKYERYQPGRSFYVEKINGVSALDFLEEHWPYTRKQLLKLAREKKAIPSEPHAHWVTIASSLSRRDKLIWPNIPVWLERVKGEMMMRMVRAEDDDANYYLMRLRPESLRENARDLMADVRNTKTSHVSMLALLCESRKYVLNDVKSNAEANEMIGSAPDDSCVIGVYVNGEYSAGHRRSIGYHNYSQIGAIFARRPLEEIPEEYRKSGLAAELFACHASVDKHTVKAFLRAVQQQLGTSIWIDEQEVLHGDVLKDKIRAVVGRGNQFVVPFISQRSVDSKWVERELTWALREEKRQKRMIVLPVVIDDHSGDKVIDLMARKWKADVVNAIRARLYIALNDFTDDELQLKAKRMADDLAERLEAKGESQSLGTDPFKNLRPGN